MRWWRQQLHGFYIPYTDTDSLRPSSMLALPARRNSLCLFCAAAVRTPQPPRLRLLPRIQVACRSTANAKKPTRGRVQGDSQDRGRNGRPIIRYGGQRLDENSIRRDEGDRVRKTVDSKLKKLQAEFSEPAFLNSLQLNEEQFDKEWTRFKNAITAWVKKDGAELNDLVHQAGRGKATLERRLRYLFYAQIYGGRFTKAETDNQKQLADLRYPAEWYPATREVPRVVHMHVGPTNSGKTYHALKRLEAADSGIYLGPLRLLAHEVFTRLNAMGRPCALVTGEEQRVPEGDAPPMYSCTVEMAPLNTKFDVAVIDEIQMINHKERGWAWTQAFLGLQAREIHLCGEARTVNIMRELCALVGDEVHVHTYQRLTPLGVEKQSLHGNMKKLQKGDCLVAFSVVGIHALRRQIEKSTGKKCAIVYGSLPPETRAQQARLFNDPDNNYDYLVASDAIGMGLNLYVPFHSRRLNDANIPQRYQTCHFRVDHEEQRYRIRNPADLRHQADCRPRWSLQDCCRCSEESGWRHYCGGRAEEDCRLVYNPRTGRSRHFERGHERRA